MVQRRHGDLDIGVPVTARVLDVAVVSVLIVVSVLAKVLAGAEATGEASACVELTLYEEAGNISAQADGWTFLPITLN